MFVFHKLDSTFLKMHYQDHFPRQLSMGYPEALYSYWALWGACLAVNFSAEGLGAIKWVWIIW